LEESTLSQTHLPGPEFHSEDAPPAAFPSGRTAARREARPAPDAAAGPVADPLPSPDEPDGSPLAAGGGPAERGTAEGKPDAASLATLAAALGVPRLTAAPPWGRPGGRVWRLQAPGRGAAWFLKRAPQPLEPALLRLLRGLDVKVAVPAVVAGLRGVAAEAAPSGYGDAPLDGAPPGQAVDAGSGAVCLTEVPGVTLDRALHAGAAIPVDAWGRAVALFHDALAPAAVGGADTRDSPSPREQDPPRLPDPQTDVGGRLMRWASLARRLQTADAHAIIGQALGALPALAARAAADLGPEAVVVCHGAWTPDHLLLDRGEVSGTVDWEHACIAPAGYDLATAVVGLFRTGVSARAALALGDALAAAYTAASGRQPRLMAFYLVLSATERLMDAVERRAARTGGADVQAWMGLLGLCLARGAS